MKYSLETTSRFDKELKKLDKYTQKLITGWIRKNLLGCENPRLIGKAMSADLKKLWRYRIGDYRLICVIEDNILTILALSIGHRKKVHDSFKKKHQ